MSQDILEIYKKIIEIKKPYRKRFRFGDRVRLSQQGRFVHIESMKSWRGTVIRDKGGWVYIQWDETKKPMCYSCKRRDENPVWSDRPEFIEQI